jgi:protein O-GlcNAc transferase
VPADNVAVINATDLSPILENTQVKEIREIISSDLTDTKQSRPVEISIKVAELPTTTPIEVSIFLLCEIYTRSRYYETFPFRRR